MLTRKMKYSGIKWIGEIPEDWEIRRLKYTLEERKEKNNPIVTDNILSLSVKRGIFPYAEKTGGGNKSKSDLTAYKVAHPNDIVINSMNILAGAVGLSRYMGVVSPVYYTLYTTSEEINITYYYYLFRTREFQRSLLGLGNGIMMRESSTGKLNTIRMRIPMDKLAGLFLPLPPRRVQDLIVKSLAKDIKVVNKLINQTEQSIKELKKYKQSLITEAVTKGIDPNVEMKDSGIEWIDNIPRHWDIRSIGNYYFQVKDKNLLSQEENLLSLSYGKIVKRNYHSTDGLLPANFNNYIIVEPNDIVLRMTDLQNDHKSLRTGFVNERGIITSAYIILRPQKNQDFISKFIQLFLHSFDIYKGFYGMGSGVRQNVTFNDIKKLKIILPPIIEQKQIIRYLENRVSTIDNLIENKIKVIEELENYKKSLIYEYATGKKEV